MKVFIVSGGPDYRKLFEGMGHTITHLLRQADLCVFTGGADVTPALYGDAQHALTGNHIERDQEEMKLFKLCQDNQIPVVGICRGAQFLNVMSGGRMYQHVEKHTRSHYIVDAVTGETVYVSSTHHQMMMPSPDALLVATAALGGEREWFDGSIARRDVSACDIEVVFYPHTKALCFQPHPEFRAVEYDGMQKYFQTLLSRYLEVV